MKLILPNMRFLALASEDAGRDWFEKQTQIDKILANSPFELSEESVFLLYRHSPEEILEGEMDCLVARSVIGPQKSPEAPFKLIDWKEATVFQEKLVGNDWNQLFKDVLHKWQLLERENGLKLPVFMLDLRRKLAPELELSAYAIFSE